MANPNRFYTIMQDEAGKDDCWLLGPLSNAGDTKAACERAISWQHTGGNYQPMHVCEHIGSGIFKNAAGQEFHPRRGPYNETAWNRFLDSLATWEDAN